MNCVDSENMTVDITQDEMDYVIKNCKNNKSPGLDGLPYEFYKCVYPVIGVDLRCVLQCQLDRGELISSNTLGATRLTPKVSGNP